MIIKNAQIVLHHFVIPHGYLVVENGKISAISQGDYVGEEREVIDAKGNTLMPGFIDVHIHGSLGIDFMDATSEEIHKIGNTLYKEGVTSFLATTLTSDKNSLLKVCKNVKGAMENTPSCVGIHLEGPYISLKYKGAQNPDYIRNPSIDELNELQEASGHHIKYISLAPEKEGSLAFIKEAVKQGVTISCGHSDATFDEVGEAIKVGLSATTHTHNAMSGHHHRNPGVVTAAMYFDELFTEMIADKIHVTPNTMKTFFKVVGSDRLVLITDALKAKHADVKKFELFGLPVEVKDGAAYLESGPLAGSLLTMDQALRNMREVAGLSLVELAKVSSTNAANSIHLFDRGMIKVGYKADLVLLDKDFKVLKTFKDGKEVYSHD